MLYVRDAWNLALQDDLVAILIIDPTIRPSTQGQNLGFAMSIRITVKHLIWNIIVAEVQRRRCELVIVLVRSWRTDQRC